MRIDLTGALRAASGGLLATVLARPARQTIAAVTSPARAGLSVVIAVRHTAAGAPAINVRIRRRRSP